MNRKHVPVRKEKQGVISTPRVPQVGPLVPRLQQEFNTNAIGFTAYLTSED